MQPHVIRKYEDMVAYFKQLEAKKTSGGIPLYRRAAIIDMVAEKFYLTTWATDKIIQENYDKSETNNVASNQGSLDFPQP